ncbi:hypothetical protein E2K93_15945 [Thalassotalea sp. HSM 43]|uniref:hypothetical protein n=1 Tax=Thalassotalea sp. HSM 43 TaxID=2552945 RepID=UPI00108049D7|nr:hypothetical protein [Thalassotalea sp. HSM 43]QBY05761.1 hypothetical protein E2K93_15945 [Thalassotalea sp. HSM 43]
MKTLMICLITGSSLLFGCENTANRAFDMDKSAVESRSFQSRTYEGTDKMSTLRSVVATLQDLGFVVEKADADFGVISATKLSGYHIRLTITVRDQGDGHVLVRTNAHHGKRSIDDPEPYRDFYTALDKSQFLLTHKVDY